VRNLDYEKIPEFSKAFASFVFNHIFPWIGNVAEGRRPAEWETSILGNAALARMISASKMRGLYAVPVERSVESK